MRTITQQELDAICKNGEAIDFKGGYPAVVIHPDETVSKIWARKRGVMSSAYWRPYAKRFVINAGKLANLGVPVPRVVDCMALEGSHVRLVTYQSLPGKSIRDLLRNSPDKVDIHTLCLFFKSLHDKGIYYRAIHLGNVIQLPDGSYGLIDFTDVSFSSRSLSLKRRAANLAITESQRYGDDQKMLQEAGHPSILNTYVGLLDLSPKERQCFMDQFERYVK